MESITEVLDGREPWHGVRATASTTLELLWLLGESALARRLLSAAGDIRRGRADSFQTWIAAAEFELKNGDAAAARRAMTSVSGVHDLADVRLRVQYALASADLSLLEDDAAAALSQLPADDTPGMNDEMRLRCLGLRLRAERQSGAIRADTLSAAREKLAAPSPYIPATLELHRALASVEPTSVDVVERVAASLAAYPEQKAAFLRIYG